MDGNVVSAESLAPTDTEGAQLRAALESNSGNSNISDESDEQEVSQEPSSPEQSESGADAADKQEKAKEGTPEDATRSSEPSAEEEVPLEPKSSYQARVSERDKLAKDQQRLAENWKKFEEGKLGWQERQAQELAELKRLLAQRQRQAPQQAPTPQEYVTAAKQFEVKAKEAAASGDIEQAQKFMDLAARSRDEANREYWKQQQTEYQQYEAQFAQAWNKNMNAELEKHPELGDPNSEASKHMQQLLQQYPIFGTDPGGFSLAVQVLELRQKAAEGSGLREKLTQAEKQLKELQDRTSIRGGGVVPRTEQNIDDLSMEEQGKALRGQLVDTW